MYDLAQPNDAPGTCCKCRGTGIYAWGAFTNGVPAKSGPCYSCKGTGRQDKAQIRTNHTYNRHKLASIAAGMTSERERAEARDQEADSYSNEPDYDDRY
jgi:DnaJ-class molecular chaperone